MANPNPIVVVIEDDPPIRRFLRTGLGTHGFEVFEAGIRKPDLIILDLGLPDMDGVEVVKAVRKWSDMPIIILSVRSAEQNKIEVLDAGADDYLTKPFGLGEPLARIRVALRHSLRNPEQSKSEVFTTGSIKEVWGPAYMENSHYLRIYMSQLRQKLEADPAQPKYLLTESGIGYRLKV